MKKLMALFLSLCMLMSMACAENAFTQGLDALLDSIRPGRDMLTLAFQGEQPVTVCLRTEGDMTDITAEMPGGVVHVQVEGHDIYLTAGERAMHLNLDELTGAAGQGMQMDPGVAGELIQLMLEKLIMPFATVNMNEGLHIAYRADGADLLSALAELLDSVITEEKYARMLEQFMSFLGTVSGEAMPALEQIRESWPQVREEMVNQETDFQVWMQTGGCGISILPVKWVRRMTCISWTGRFCLKTAGPQWTESARNALHGLTMCGIMIWTSTGKCTGASGHWISAILPGTCI